MADAVRDRHLAAQTRMQQAYARLRAVMPPPEPINNIEPQGPLTREQIAATEEFISAWNEYRDAEDNSPAGTVTREG